MLLLLAILAMVSLATLVRLQIRTASKNRFTLIEEMIIMGPMWFVLLPIMSWMFPDIWVGVIGHFFMSWGYVYNTVLTGVLCVSIGLSLDRPTYLWDKPTAVLSSVILLAFGLGMMWDRIPYVQWDSNVHQFLKDTFVQWMNTCGHAMLILVWFRAARYWDCTMGRAFMNSLMCSAKAMRLTVRVLKRDGTSTWSAFWIIAILAFAFGHNVVVLFNTIGY